MKKEFMLSLLFLSLIMLSTMTSPASATDYTKVGVKVGDTADYSYTSPTGTGVIRIHILQITRTNVTINTQTLYSYGQEIPNTTVTGNLSATPNKLFPILVTANLSIGDHPYPGSYGTIIQTISMDIIGFNRTVNRQRYSLLPIPAGIDLYYFDAYWDKATGLLVHMNVTLVDDSWGNQTGSTILTLTATTAFGALSPPTILILASGVATPVALLAIAAITQEKQKPSSP